ncbi:MAG: SUMF1/EgtB/PvdO family nonheme iron enzyme [Candidatus Electryonea clarkiae]|nr:SUMF1/EgtB/PvdO family nonheme iron enzyme [Candidatus Electryonea clarkiae]MDP8285861.1 SUMF1/EgtB/PvdO family nonheme iron enzyme [Candidatus Electryonea clarkiae]
MKWQRFSFFSAILLSLILGCGHGGGGGLSEPDSTNTPPDTSGRTIQIEKIEIEEGPFIRRYDDIQNFPDEAPSALIQIDKFFISKTEVTNSQYAEFLNDGNEIHYDGRMKIGIESSRYIAIRNMENHPVVWVDYENAAAFAVWAGGRLPTEAEWEKAARGIYGIIYPWGNDADGSKADLGRYPDENTLNVGTYPRGDSPYGVQDMAGSVWEWCHDWYYHYYYSTPPVVTDNPTGPELPIDYLIRSIRGGSFLETLLECRCSNRNYLEPEFKAYDLGFRVAWDE